MKHTPGPWHFSSGRQVGPKAGIDIGADDNSNVAEVIHADGEREWSETRANARLIAAAPQLLDRLNRTNNLLRGLLEFVTLDHDALTEVQTVYAENRHTIAQATGGGF